MNAVSGDRTVLQVVVGQLPDGRTPPKDLWLWHAGPVPADPDLLWKAYLRRSGQGTPARSPKPARPGPGRPKGSKNRPKSKRPPYRKSEPTTSKHGE